MSLVLSCESLLADRVDDSSVFDLLTVAETLNACTLKVGFSYFQLVTL